MEPYIILIILFSIIVFIILFYNNPSYKSQHSQDKIRCKPDIKPFIKKPKFEDHTRSKFSNDIKVVKSQKPSQELLSMYPEASDEVPSDNPFMCTSKPQKKQLPYSNVNVELYKKMT